MALSAFDSDAFSTDAFEADAFLFTEAGVVIPDVVAQSQASGTAELEGDGFVVAVATAYSSTVAAGDIISQSPAAGIEAPAGSTVTITVSLGDQPQDDDGFFEEWAKRGRKDRKKPRVEQLQAGKLSEAELAVFMLWVM